MYQIVLGKVSTLSAGQLPDALIAQAPQGVRRASWLAGRVLLSRALSPLPEMVYGEQGKPAFSAGTPLWFNLSHSGDTIALLLSDEGEVGCDIEVIRPRDNWRSLANAVFSLGEHAEMEAERPERQLAAFWRIWTRKEAIVKQRGGSAWQIVSVDSTLPSALSVSQCQLDTLSLAVCTPTPFTLTPQTITKRYDTLIFPSGGGRVLQNAELPMRRRAIPKGLSQMQRVTITLDDDLLETLDSLSQRRGYNNRSEAIRDILRGALAQEATQEHGTQGFAVLSYVYEHEKRDLASRIVSTQHHHHDLSVATLHVHINHDDCLEIAVLKGDMGDVQHFADDVIAQRGVRHGHLQCLPKED